MGGSGGQRDDEEDVRTHLLAGDPEHAAELLRRTARYAIGSPRDYASFRAVSRGWRRNTRYHASVFRDAAMDNLMTWVAWRPQRLHLPTVAMLLRRRISWLRYRAGAVPYRGSLAECTSRMIRATDYMAHTACWRGRCMILCWELRAMRRHRNLRRAEAWIREGTA